MLQEFYQPDSRLLRQSLEYRRFNNLDIAIIKILAIGLNQGVSF